MFQIWKHNIWFVNFQLDFETVEEHKPILILISRQWLLFIICGKWLKIAYLGNAAVFEKLDNAFFSCLFWFLSNINNYKASVLIYSEWEIICQYSIKAKHWKLNQEKREKITTIYAMRVYFSQYFYMKEITTKVVSWYMN